VTVGYASGTIPRIPLNLVLLKGIEIVGFQMLTFATNEPRAFAANEAELIELLATGRVRPYIGRRFVLDDVVDALQYVAGGKAIGKVALDVSR
jgi:NADPH2:quinone reductase